MGRKIRDAELRKAPYMLIVGDEEERSEAVAVRRHGEGDLGGMAAAAFAARAREEIDARRGAGAAEAPLYSPPE